MYKLPVICQASTRDVMYNILNIIVLSYIKTVKGVNFEFSSKEKNSISLIWSLYEMRESD